MLLEEQFREGWLYASLAKAQLQPSEIASAVGNFGKYLKHRKDNPENYSSEDALDFACHCPLCRGEAGVHYIRVFDLACNLYAAVYTVRQATEHNRDLLREPITDYFHKAVRFLRQGAEKLTSISWKATDPLRDLLHQYAARYPDPAMNLIDELLHYFLHGRWREPQRKVAATFPLAFQNGGAIAKLALEQTDALVPGFYPHPELLLATRWDRDFAEQFACAWQHHAPDKTAALRWELEPYRSEGRVWDGVPISGPSVGAAAGVALKCIENPNQPPPDIDCALTGKLEPDGTLGSVGGYLQKTLPFDRYSALHLVIPHCDSLEVRGDLPDWSARLIAAQSVNEALEHAIQLPRAVRTYLERLIAQLDDIPLPLYHNGQKLTNQQLFTPLRVLVQKPPLERSQRTTSEQSRESESRRGFRGLLDRYFRIRTPSATYQRIEPQPQEASGDPFEELRSEFYDSPYTLLRRQQQEEMLWRDFTKNILSEAQSHSEESASRGHKRFALIGPPGSGKTFGTRHLAITVAQNALQQLNKGQPLDEIRIPFWLPANKLGETGDLKTAITQELSEVPLPWLERVLQKGLFLLVIDALDELPEHLQKSFRKCVQQLDATAGVVLVTCRTMHWEKRSRWLGWRTLPNAAELAPLNPREQRALAEKFFGKGTPQALSIQQTLRESYVLRHACRTPLLLIFACMLHREDALPSNITYATLYADIVKYFLQGKWRTTEVSLVTTEGEEADVYEMLDTIAWNLFRQSPEQNAFTRRAWLQAASECPQDAPLSPRKLMDALEQLGLVIFAGYSEQRYPQWSFAHRSILEFLAARYLSHQPNWLDEISQHFWFQPEWVEVLTFLSGLVGNADPLVERLEQEGDDIFGSMLYLQARVVGFGKVSETLAQRVAERAVKWYLRARVPNQFTLPILQAIGRHAVQPLCNVIEQANHAPRMVRILQKIPLLEDRRRKTLAAACEALEVIGHPAAVDTLRSILTSEEDFEIVRQAIRALCAIGDRSAVRALIQEMQNRGFAAYQPTEEWSKLDTVEAIEELTKILGTPNQPWIRKDICSILGAIGSDKAVDPLIRALNDPEAQVRSAACHALGAIGSDKAVDPLIRALDDPEVGVRIEACYALGAIGGDRAADALLQALDSERNSSVRTKIYEALGEMGYAKSIDKLVERGLREPEVWVYSRACKALGKLLLLPELDQRRQELAVTALIEASQNGHPRFRLEAAKVLVEIGSPHAAEALENILREVQRTIREEVFAVLERGDWPVWSFSILCDRLEFVAFEDRTIHREACALLAKIGSQLSVQTLIDSLRSDFDLFLEVACRVLGVDTIQGSRLIQQAIQEEDKRIRRRARRELKKINRDSERILTYAASPDSWYKSLVDATRGSLSIITKPEAVPTLVDALESNDAYIELVVSICDTLGAIGDERAVDALIQRAKHSENVRVRKAACHALGAIGTPEAIQTLMEIALRGDRSTCWAAFVAIYKAGAGRGYNYIASLLRGGRGEPQDEKLTRFLLGCAQYQISALERLRAIGGRSAIRHLLFIGDDHETQIEAYVTAVEICFKDIKPEESRNSQNCKMLASFLFTFFPYWALTDRPLMSLRSEDKSPLLWNLLFTVCAFFKSRLTHSRFFQISLLKKLFSEFVIKMINAPSWITDIISLFSARFWLRVSQRANPSGSLLDNWMWLWMVPPLGIRIISSLHVAVVTLLFLYLIISSIYLLLLAMICCFISPKLVIYLFIGFAIMSIFFWSTA